MRKTELETIDLDVMVQPVARITISKKQHFVLPANGQVAELMERITTKGKGVSPTQSVTLLRQIVQECVPSLDEADIRRMGMPQMIAVTQIATQQMESVKKTIAEHEKNVQRLMGKQVVPSARKSSIRSVER